MIFRASFGIINILIDKIVVIVALKKPSEFFNKKDELSVNETVQELIKSSELNTFSDAFESFKNNLVKIESLSEFSETINNYKENVERVDNLSSKVENIQSEIQNLLKKEDLDRAMMAQLLVVEQSIINIQNNVKGINEKNLSQIKLNLSNLSKNVNEFLEVDVPKYKKLVTESEIRSSNRYEQLEISSSNRYEQLEDKVNLSIENIQLFVDESYKNLSDALSEINKEVVEDIISEVNSLSEVIENIKENEIPRYKKVIVETERKVDSRIKDFNQKFEDINVSLTEKIKSIESSKNNLLEKIDLKLEEVEDYIQKNYKDIVTLRDQVFEEVEKISIGDVEKNIRDIKRKVEYIESVYKDIKPEELVGNVISETLLAEPPSAKNKDPLTPLDQKYVTLDQLQEHYRLFINRIQQQLATLGGGGETQLKYLDDIVGIATNPSAYDGKFLKYDHPSKKFVFSDITENNVIVAEENIIYVAKDGNDSNDGTLSQPKLTIKNAVGIASANTVVKIAPGTYYENNPIVLPDNVSVMGHSLRETTVVPLNSDQDLFHVGNKDYIAEMSFTGSLPGKAIVAFDPVNQRYINQSPYIQNCTNFIPNSIGMKIDGKDAIGPLKSMVLDSYTQYNQGGIGVSITNEGYAQLVSLFTICDDIAVYCGSGSGCDLTNSNSSFGNFGLVADGVSAKKYTGIVTVTSAQNSDSFVINLESPTLNVVNADYNHLTGRVKIVTNQPHKMNVGMAVSIVGLAFTCPFENGVRYYPSGDKGYVFNVETVAPGRYLDAANLITANRQEIIDQSYSGITSVFPLFVNPNPEKCKRDIGYIVDAVVNDLIDFTSRNTITATKSYFKYDGTLITGISSEVSQTVVGFHTARDYMKLAITNNLTVKDLSVIADPLTGFNTSLNSCADVVSFIDNLVGIVTTRLVSGDLNINPLPSVSIASTIFTLDVGIATQPHYYAGGGTVHINTIRPFDGQVVYFNELFYTVKTLNIVDGGSGYTELPTVTIESPDTPWGVVAQAAPILQNGVLIGVDMISNGRGYRIPPKVTISAGINTAVATAELVPEYYTVQKASEIINGECTVTLNENIPFEVGVGTEVSFFKQSRVLATGHSFEFIGSGTDIASCLPFSGGVPNSDNETDSRNGGLVVYTSTNQSGNFKIGDGVTVNQNTGSITGNAYTKSLLSTMTPYILSLGGF